MFYKYLAVSIYLACVVPAVTGCARLAAGEQRRTAALPKGRAGVTHVAGDYRFTDDNYLLEGVDKAVGLGARSMMFFFQMSDGTQSTFRVQYPDAKAGLWPKATPANLVELAKTKPFHRVFSSPKLTTIVLTAYGKAFPWGPHLDKKTDYAAEVDEFYALTKHLLTTYRGGGKVFILTNWEGENIIGAKRKLAWNHQEEFGKGDLKAMEEWLSARQRGVAKARAEVGETKGVQVYHAVTIVRTREVTHKGTVRLINGVIPQVRPDMVGYSCYDAMITNKDVTTKARTKASMAAALATIDKWAPDPLGLGRRRIYIAEFGLFENDSVQGRPAATRAEAVWRTEAVMESVKEFGASYAFFWELFDNECKPPSPDDKRYVHMRKLPSLGRMETALGGGNPRRPTNNAARGLYLPRPDGSEGPAVSVLRRYW
jgi:hypothetical protein